MAQHTGTAKFVEKTGTSGVDFTYVNGEEAGHFSILESLGGGGALFDFDWDGWLDVMLAGGGRFGTDQAVLGAPNGLYRGLGNWEWTDIAETAHAQRSPYYSHGVSTGDFDGDGFPDALITGYGGLTLLRNEGDGTFTDQTEAAGLIDTTWSSSAAWADLTGDGHLDLYVAHYVNWSFDNHPECRAGNELEICPPRQFDGLRDTLYFSNADGTFRDVTDTVGLEADGKGLGVVIADFDLNGSSDVYVCNDTTPNFLYRNDGAGGLDNQALFSGTALSDQGTAEGSMGVDVGDFNGDGLPDIWVANYENESYGLYRNSGDFFFQHISRLTGVTAMGGLFVGWGTAFLDVDRDGDEDLIATNGHVIRHPMNAPLRQLPLLLENLRGERFVDVATNAGQYFAQPHMGRGLAVGDLDRDGDCDVLITHTNEPAALLSNETPNDHHWLGLRLVGTQSNRDSIGARIRLVTPEGPDQYRQVIGGGSYASTSSPEQLFGLGTSHEGFQVEVVWPSGASRRVELESVDRRITLVEPRHETVESDQSHN